MIDGYPKTIFDKMSSLQDRSLNGGFQCWKVQSNGLGARWCFSASLRNPSARVLFSVRAEIGQAEVGSVRGNQVVGSVRFRSMV